MKNQKIFDFFIKKNDESTSDLNGPNNISSCISEPASTKRPRLENETLDEPLPNSSNNLQYVSYPGIRIPILQHPIELQDEVRRAYIDKGPIQPIYDYPFTECEGQKRRFQSSWFKKYPWLEFSIEKQSAFCFPCYVFDTNSAQFDTFTVTGFKNWKRVNCKNCPFKRHEGDGNSRHSFAMRKWGDLKNLDQHIDRRLEKQSSKQIEQNRLLLKVSIESVKFLAMQGCAFRGHDESVASKNRGNYLELVALLGRMNPEIGSTLEKASKNAKYTSPEIQREILKIIADIVRDKIRAEIGEAKFCILVDEAIDESSKEQMAIILRYVDWDGFIRERFFEVVHVENTSALTLKKEICNVFNQYNLLTKNLSGQGYDGASNMRGEWNGLQALFLKDSPHAYYIHCFAHRLQLALVAISKEIRDDRWEGFLWSVLKFCESNDVEVPDFDDCYTRVIDFQLMELNERFPEGTIELLTLSNALSPIDGFKSFSLPDICSLVDKFYYYDFNLEERGDLERELDHYKFDTPRHAQFQNLNSLHHLCQTLARTTKSVIYLLIDRLVRLVLTLPVSTATTEQAFLGMKLIKTPLRNKMENDLMANTMVVYIERDIASGIDTEFIINKFDVLKNRKIRLK
ncbi:zinc finger MYM-type protein 1-like [Zingiber officinale]|uniref:zinc finger MYM-type protein 1-like n=1 Tax=Zingiber officinale TaxID=94328 RepID=UPI001C4CFD82|nr:zinc finger MYM-type protein 1-like [Zingiber officinale]